MPRLTFAQMIAYLNGVAAGLKRNSVGDIAVTVIGVDAVKKRRSRARGCAQGCGGAPAGGCSFAFLASSI